MKKIKCLKNILPWCLSFLLFCSACSVEPDFYSQVVPETFYDSQDNVWQRFNRPFTHWRWYLGQSEHVGFYRSWEQTSFVCLQGVATGITVVCISCFTIMNTMIR